MKNQLLLFWLVSMLTGLTSCQQKVPVSCMTPEDSAIVVAWKKIFKNTTPDMLVEKMDKQVKDHPWVNDCKKNYQNIFSKSKDPDIAQAYEEEVKYDAHELFDWIATVLYNTDCDNIRIQYGVYKGLPSHPPLSSSEGQRVKDKKLTVFLWPYTGNTTSHSNKKGAEEDPFDLGEIHPPY